MSLFTRTFPYAGLVDVHYRNINNDKPQAWPVLFTFGPIYKLQKPDKCC